jgi:hypothetical protein
MSKRRTKGKAEVFTPIWIVKKQNEIVDQEFKNLELKDYISKVWLEIACGEAPYMVSRYDSVTGEFIPIQKRVGFIDKKLNRISQELEDEIEWINYAKLAYQTSFGYEFQGDSLLIARENLLYSFLDYYVAKFNKQPEIKLQKEIAKIISYNIFQMDGLNYDVYGGNQSSPLEAYLAGDSKISDIIKKYYPNMSDKEIKQYLQKLENEGCGYVALVNTFLNHYQGSEKDFEKEFGFPLYSVVNDEKVINYNYLIADLYASQDNHNSEGILFWKKGRIDKNEDPSTTEGYGTTADMREYRFENYLNNHNVKVDVINGEGFLGMSKINADMENYNQYHNQGAVIISVSPIKMTDSQGNAYNSNGGHAMTVTGKTKDGKLIISSWGQKFYIDPKDYGVKGHQATFQVIEYEK